MRLITPQTISLTSSNIAVSTESEWAVGTSYTIDDVVLDSRTQPHKTYTCLATSSVGDDPALDDGTTWQDNGATERWKMFDDFVNTQSTNSSSIEVVLETSNVDHISAHDFDATEITINIYDKITKANVYTETFDQTVLNVSNWWEWYFNSIQYKTAFGTSIPPYSNATITVTFTRTSGTAKCGHLVMGKSQLFGGVRFAPMVGINDFSRKQTDANFGVTYLAQGSFAKTNRYEVYVPTNKFDIVFDALVAVRGTPVVFEGNSEGTNYTSLLVYGFTRNFNKVLEDFQNSTCLLEIEGLV